MLARLKDRPIVAALLIALGAQTLFSLHLGRPGMIVFDEVHYVLAARALLLLDSPHNIEHPMLAKELMAAGMALFGDNTIGWRAFSTAAGTVTVVSAFAFLRLLFCDTRTAALGALFVAVNQLVFVNARVGMLEAYLGAFTMAGIATLLAGMRSERHAMAWWIAGSALLGLATAVKWAAAPYVALAGLAFLLIRRRDGLAVPREQQPHWRGLGTIAALTILGSVSVVTYFLTFTPAFFYHTDPLTLSELLPLQQRMMLAQTQVLPRHPYQSDWWSWPLMLRPIWYFYQPDRGVMRGVMLVGNPVVLWGGLVAVAGCTIGWIKARDPRLLALALLWSASLALWAIIPKSLGFFYYYQLPAIFIALALAGALHHVRGRWRWLEPLVALLAVALFAYFYPILSGAPLEGANAFTRWTWFSSWI